MSSFQKEYPAEERKREAMRILQKYPDRIPVIVNRAPKEKDLPEIDKKKYLVPVDMTFAQFLMVIRKRIRLSPEKALFVFSENNELPKSSDSMQDLYEKHKNKSDLFVYFTYCAESTFGSAI